MLRRSRARIVGLCAVISLAASACGQVESLAGAAEPADEDVKAYRAERFDAAYDLVDESMVNIQDITATVFWHGRYNERTTNREVDIVYYADQNSSEPQPPAFFTLSRAEEGAGNNFDEYHFSGSNRDYALLGPAFRELVPTEWVAYPTLMHADGFNVCFITGWQTLCNLQTAIERTHRRSPTNIVKEYVELDDGRIQLTTGATVEFILDSRVFGDQSELLNELSKELLEQFVRTTIVLSPEGHLLELSMNGLARAGADEFEVDVGFEVTGESSAEDFPPPPSPLDVTVLNDAEKSEFFDRVGEINNS